MASDIPMRPTGGAAARLVMLALLACGGSAVTGLVLARWMSAPAEQPTPVAPGQPAAPLFQNWPPGRAPDAVLVLTGQRYGYLKFCGCSSPQSGGLERLYNLLEQLRGRSWAVVPIDLGDLTAGKGLHDLAKLKYATTMRAYEKMHYAAVGVGIEEVKLPLLNALAEFTLQQPVPSPRVLLANLLNRAQDFPGQNGSMIDDYALAAGPNQPTVGIAGIAGATVSEAMAKQDEKLKFAPNNPAVLRNVLAAMAAEKTPPQLRVLLYQGDQQGAEAAAKAFPDFQVVLHTDLRDEPQGVPTIVKHPDGRQTLLIAVGHKVKYAGVLGAFKNARGGFDFYYELVRLDPQYETPSGQEASHPILQILEEYSRTVRDKNYISHITQVPHPAQITLDSVGKNGYVGSDRCQTCHAAEFRKWQETKHAHAYAGLSTAKKPAGRQFDPECIVCHSVGYSYLTGYTNEQQTPHLKDVGCESCHGPGSLHVGDPRNKTILAELSPWKARPVQKDDRLPTAEALARGGPFPQAEKRVLDRADQVCQRCHDMDNDPHFNFEKFWPKVVHSNLPQQPPPPAGQPQAPPPAR